MEMNGYQITTDQTNWNLNSGDFTMPHEVKVTRPGTDARGDKAKGNTHIEHRDADRQRRRSR